MSEWLGGWVIWQFRIVAVVAVLLARNYEATGFLAAGFGFGALLIAGEEVRGRPAPISSLYLALGAVLIGILET